MGTTQSGLLGNSQSMQNGHVDLARIRSAIREQSQQDPTKQQLYALLLEEYAMTDDDNTVSRDPPVAPALVTREDTSSSKTDSPSQAGDNNVTRKLSPDCSRDCDSTSKASDSDSGGQKTPSDIGDVAKTPGGSMDKKVAAKPSQVTTCDGPAESRKRSHCSDIIAPKKKFLHGFRNRSNNVNIDQSDGDAKVVPVSVTSSSSSSSSNDGPKPDSNGTPESRSSSSSSGTPETPGVQSNSESVSLPTAMPNNLRIRNIIETLMNTDMIRRHLEYDGPENEMGSPVSGIAKPADGKSVGSEDGSPQPLEPQTIQNQMQRALLMDTHSQSLSCNNSLHQAKPSTVHKQAGPLQLIKEQVISISPGRECHTSSAAGPYRVMSSVRPFDVQRNAKYGAVMSSASPVETKQGREQFAYNVQSSQMLPAAHSQFVDHARPYQSTGISTDKGSPGANAGTDPYNVVPPGGASWIGRRNVLAGMSDTGHQPFERFHPGEDRLVEERPRDGHWADSQHQEVPLGCVNICPQIVDKNATPVQALPPPSMYRMHAGGGLTRGCPDVANSLGRQQECTSSRSEPAVYNDRLMSPRSRFDGARPSHEMLNHHVAGQLHGAYMSGGTSNGATNRAPPHTPEPQRSPPGAYPSGGLGCSGNAGCHGCSSVTSVRQPVVTSRPHSRYDMTRWELTHQHELPSRIPQQTASPVRVMPQRESPSHHHHMSPIPGIELSQQTDIVQSLPCRGPPPLIPLTASQATHSPLEPRQRCPSQPGCHHGNDGGKPWTEKRLVKESPLDLSGRKEQFAGPQNEVNIPLDLSVKNVPMATPSPPISGEDVQHYKKREVSQSFMHPQQNTPAGDVGSTQWGNTPVGFPNMSQHILKLQQSINRTIQDIDEPSTRFDPPTHPNQLHRHNISPENTHMKQYSNTGSGVHHPPPPLWHVPLGGVPREYPNDNQRLNPSEVKMLVPPPAPAFPPGKAGMQKTSFRYGTVNILGNHPPNDILFLRCNLCGLTYGSQHSIKKHFTKVHGRDPTPDAVAVQTISDMRNAISQAGEKLAKAHQDGTDQCHTSSPGPKSETPPEQILRSKPEQNKAAEKRAEGEKSKKREPDAKNCQALSPLRKSSQRVARAPLVKRDGDSDNNNSDVGGEKSMMKCLQCGQDFPTRDWGVFRRHVRTHDLTPNAIYKCTVCSVGFCDAVKRRTHMSTAHSITSCMCRKCNIGFTHIGALNKHLKTAHMDGQRVDVEYRCLYCPKYFAVQDDLILHTQRHETTDENADVTAISKPAKDKAVLVPTVIPPAKHMTPDTAAFDKFPYPDLTIAEDPIVIDDSKRNMSPAVKTTAPLPWKPTMSHHVPTGKTLQEMLMERLEPRGRKEAEVIVNGTNVTPALGCVQTTTTKQDDDIKVTSPAASHDQNMKRRLDTQIPATEQLTKKVKPEVTVLPKIACLVDEQAIQTAQSLLRDIVNTANFGVSKGESLHDKESKVAHIMRGVLKSFPVLRHKPENIREVIETLVTANLTGELPRRLTSDSVQDARNISEETSSSQQVAVHGDSQRHDVSSDVILSPNGSNKMLPHTSEKSTDGKAVEREPTSLKQSQQNSDEHKSTNTSVLTLKDVHDIPTKASVASDHAPCEATRVPEKTASERAMEDKSDFGMTMLEPYVPKKTSDYRKSGKSLAKPAKQAEASSHHHTPGAMPSTSGSFNPLRGLQFSDFHPTLCTDHACEGNYLEKLHGHCNGHKHCGDKDEEDVACKKEKLEDVDNGADTTSVQPFTDGSCDWAADKTSVRQSFADESCDKSHQQGSKSALVGKSSSDASSTMVSSDVD